MKHALADLTADGGNYGDSMGKNIYFRVWTEPNARGSGYIAFWVSPGLNPAILRNTDGTPAIFPDEHTGELAAWRRMAEVMNRPRSMATKTKPERYERLTGPEFAAALQEAGITPSFLAYLYGTSQKRVMDWIDGVPNEDVPHPIRVLMELFKTEENIDRAEAVTDAVTSERKPRRQDTG